MLKKHPLALYITWIVALAVIPLPLIILTNSQLTADYEDLLLMMWGYWPMFGGWLSFSSQLVQDGLKSILASLQCIFCMLR